MDLAFLVEGLLRAVAAVAAELALVVPAVLLGWQVALAVPEQMALEVLVEPEARLALQGQRVQRALQEPTLQAIQT
jgi:gamma-glutamyltranspeptidase